MTFVFTGGFFPETIKIINNLFPSRRLRIKNCQFANLKTYSIQSPSERGFYHKYISKQYQRVSS